MPKRQRPSSSSGPPAKRSTATRHSIADLFPLQEIFLRILSFLSANELAKVQGVSKYWQIMSLDPQLWKRLYLARYPHPHQSRLIQTPESPKTTPMTVAGSLRPIARLPSRAFPPPSPSRTSSASTSLPGTPGKLEGMKDDNRAEAFGSLDMVGQYVRNDGVDWKMMLRLGTNWSNGNVLSQTTMSLPPSPSPSVHPSEGLPPSVPSSVPPIPNTQHLALFPSFIFTASPDSPLVYCYPSPASHTNSPIGIIPPPPGWSSPSRPDNVTAICADQAVAFPEEGDGERNLPARMAVFYQSGGFVVLSVRLSSSSSSRGVTWVRDAVSPGQSRPPSIRRRMYAQDRGDPIVYASMYSRLLVACSKAFHLSVFDLQSGQLPRRITTMRSDVSFHPATLTLLPSFPGDKDGGQPVADHGTSQSFQAALTYSTPVYPSSWTIAVQEFTILLPPISSLSAPSVSRGPTYHVSPRSTAGEPIWPRKIRPAVGVKGAAKSVGMDGRWCVLAGEGNKVEVFSLPSSSPPNSTDCDDDIIRHSQTLVTHSSIIASVALASGRCVSGCKDGKVLVWELDDDAEAENNDGGGERGKMGKTVGYVEVRKGGRRSTWKGASGPYYSQDNTVDKEEGAGHECLPHPQSISSAARTLFLPQPPKTQNQIEERDGRREIRCLAFDEEKIVGVVGGGKEEAIKVWNFG
ncbi:uncharacterized protein IAS62_004528 [Cryptococcus decagattii]|uniref:F-box domain-containing protein n=1 Tax=Cryptococcus decagattii TaxID=1859122 RepID=A0ABZ2AXB9_9TREE